MLVTCVSPAVTTNTSEKKYIWITTYEEVNRSNNLSFKELNINY